VTVALVALLVPFLAFGAALYYAVVLGSARLGRSTWMLAGSISKLAVRVGCFIRRQPESLTWEEDVDTGTGHTPTVGREPA
jgi:hypothetical protein